MKSTVKSTGQSTAALPAQLNRWTILGLSLLFVLLTVVPFLWIENSEFPGADTLAEEAILEIAPETQPWFQPLWEPPGGETESLLFALQAALGAVVIGYFFGRQHGRRQASQASRPENPRTKQG